MTSDQIRVIAERLSTASQQRWHQQHLELQDGGRSLFVSVELIVEADVHAVERIRADIRHILKKEVPERDGDYAWTAAIKWNGVVVDSLMGGCSTGLPEI